MNRVRLNDKIECCGGCRFFWEGDGTFKLQEREGFCRKFAPEPLQGGAGKGFWDDWSWPSVKKNYWCGEWELKV